MNANEITFGIEIETTIPAGAARVGNYHGNTQAEGLPQGWTACRDGSIQAGAGREGCEFVSPILKGDEGFKSAMEAVKAIKAMGGEVNDSCGFHVHVGWNGDQKAMDRLVSLAANFEKALFAATGTKRRERERWTKGIARYGSKEVAISQSRLDRYHAINLTNLGRRQQTVEFRVFAGTLNIVKILGYVQLCIGLVERSLKAKRVTNFVAKKPVDSSPIARGGEGLTTLNRLFYQLGWTKGRTDKTFGLIACETAPTVDEMKAVLVRLAKKYDAQQ